MHIIEQYIVIDMDIFPTVNSIKNIYLRNTITIRLGYRFSPSKYSILIGRVPENWQFNDVSYIYIDLKNIYLSRANYDV